MSNRFAWVLGALVLVSAGFLVACGSKYSASSNGLVLTSSQGSAVVQTFSFDLASGHVSAISNPPATAGVGSAIVLDPAGAYAYVIVTKSSSIASSSTGIAAYKVNSDGSLSTAGSTVADANPIALAMDSSGKFLFVAEGLSGGVNVYSISGSALTAVPGAYTFPATASAPDLVAVAPTPTVFPALTSAGAQNAVCSGLAAPTTEYLYAADSANNVVWEFLVNTSTGALSNPINTTTVPNFATGSVPAGVAVDPCNRFVYVANQNSNNVSAYTICNGSSTQSSACPPAADGRLVAVASSPFPLSGGANGPGPMLVDPFGRFVFVVDTLSNQLSSLTISPVSGALAVSSTAATGTQPTAIAMRSDDSWIFVANFVGNSLSQYAVIPASGTLTPQPAITTDNSPWGVAVK